MEQDKKLRDTTLHIRL